jgi:hypothetical protein
MPNSELAERILAENAALRGEVGALTGKLDELEDKGRHTRWIAYVLTAAFTVVAVISGYHKVNDRVDVLQQYDQRQCVAGNDFRRSQLTLWMQNADLIRAGGGKGAAAFADKMLANATASLKLRDCEAVKSGRVR